MKFKEVNEIFGFGKELSTIDRLEKILRKGMKQTKPTPKNYYAEWDGKELSIGVNEHDHHGDRFFYEVDSAIGFEGHPERKKFEKELLSRFKDEGFKECKIVNGIEQESFAIYLRK